MRIAVRTSLLLILLAQSSYGQHMARMLDSGPFPTMAGKLLRLAEAPITGGDMADLAVADLNDDGRADLLIGSGYGDLLYYRQLSGEVFAPPEAMIGEGSALAEWHPQLRQPGAGRGGGWGTSAGVVLLAQGSHCRWPMGGQ